MHRLRRSAPTSLPDLECNTQSIKSQINLQLWRPGLRIESSWHGVKMQVSGAGLIDDLHRVCSSRALFAPSAIVRDAFARWVRGGESV